MLNFIEIFVDGGVRGNGKETSVGSWAFTAKYEHEDGTDRYIERNEASRDTTNNIMELKACVEALKAMRNPKVPVRIHSDSAYVVNGMNDWVFGWERNGWKKGKKKNEKIANLEIWQELHALRNSFAICSFVKVKGHADNEGNNRADALVNEAMDDFLRNEGV